MGSTKWTWLFKKENISVGRTGGVDLEGAEKSEYDQNVLYGILKVQWKWEKNSSKYEVKK